MHPIAMPREHPFERVVQEFTERVQHGPFSPDQASGGFQRLCVWIPPKMIAGEEKSLPIEQRHTPGCMAWYGNDLELRSHTDRLFPSNDLFCSGCGIHIGSMDDPLGAEMCGILVRIGHIVFVGQKDVGDAPSLRKDINEMFDIPRGIDQPIPVRMFNEKTIGSK